MQRRLDSPRSRSMLVMAMAVTVAAAVLTLMPASAASGDAAVVTIGNPTCVGTFLRVPGIPGSSTQQGHEGEIDVESYQYEGKKLVVTKKVDRASPKLAKAAAEQQQVGDITLTAICGGVRVTMVFKHATVTGYLQQQKPGEDPSDTVTFTFKEVEMTVVEGQTETTDSFRARVPQDRAPCGCDKVVVPAPCPEPVIPIIPGDTVD